MNQTEQIAKHLRDVHFGGNWTSVNLRQTLAGVDWQQATAKLPSFNTIAGLVYHVHYYVEAILNVLKGGPLDAHDRYSFDLPPIQSSDAWMQLVEKTWQDAEELARLVEQLPETKLAETFVEEKYGTYYRNLHGLIEHTHYHLGQMVLIKKLLRENEAASKS